MKYIVTYNVSSSGVYALASSHDNPIEYLECGLGETAEEAYSGLQKKLEKREKYLADLPQDKTLSITI